MHKLLITAAIVAALSAGTAAAQAGNYLAMMLATADANHDGNITRAEFDAARAARFAQLDADHNGSLSAAEQPHGGPHANANRSRRDTNGDGIISRAEWNTQSARMFSRVDTDNNGIISRAEAQAAQQRMQQQR